MKKYKKIDYNTKDLISLSISDLKKIADYSLRHYLLRNLYNDRGRYYCPLKMKWYPAEKMHVAHYIDRGASMWTRYSLINCHLISEQSNSWDSKILVDDFKSLHHKEYEEWLKSTYGENIIETLLDMSKNGSTFTRENYIETIEKFRDNE